MVADQADTASLELAQLQQRVAGAEEALRQQEVQAEEQDHRLQVEVRALEERVEEARGFAAAAQDACAALELDKDPLDDESLVQQCAAAELALREARGAEAQQRLQHAGELAAARTKAKLLAADVEGLQQAQLVAEKQAMRHRQQLERVDSDTQEAVAARDEEREKVRIDARDLQLCTEQLREEQMHLQAKQEQYAEILRQLREQAALVEQARALEYGVDSPR